MKVVEFLNNAIAKSFTKLIEIILDIPTDIIRELGDGRARTNGLRTGRNNSQLRSQFRLRLRKENCGTRSGA
ncbi:hypothetical protein CWS72_27225 [Telmatospirillum siberiense]|uniref:Uncharacterized protein n=1 Tax=Telmatospirillum siberiense TaxID=382514 RepID=A0A2N3PLS1_9PROT|nr:hypothetical protein CWS72_27225 [Telmatospirillum siberiense]